MRIGIIGSGIIGQLLGSKLVSLGHDVILGTRDPNDLHSKKGAPGDPAPSLAEWLQEGGKMAQVATFSEAAAHGEILINATSGMVSLQALALAGSENLAGKILMDTSNALDFSRGGSPVCLATDQEGGSVGVRIQQAFPDTKVVKALNTTGSQIIVNPLLLADGDHTVLLCGNDPGAKEIVSELLRSFGWRDIFDLGDITAAHGMEMMTALWLRSWQQNGYRPCNWKLVR
jgi:8-hydroxy-5-deazaflavin:NADPH oxidoreductase